MYWYKKQVNVYFHEAIEKTKEVLQKECFGVLTEIEVKATLKNKLAVDYDNYMFLVACNPPFAYKSLQAEKELGLLLPCNVIVYQDNRKVFVSSILPTIAMNMIESKELKEIAMQVEDKLKKVIDNV